MGNMELTLDLRMALLFHNDYQCKMQICTLSLCRDQIMICSFSALAGHFVSTKPCGCCSLGSITNPSNDAPIQLNYR